MYRNESADSHHIKHTKIDWLRQTGVGKQHSLCSLQSSVHSPAAQRRMSKQWSMPSTTSTNCVESTAGTGGRPKDSRTTTLSKSSSCRSAAGSTPKRTASNLTTEITIDIADADDDVAITSQPARRPVVRNSSVASDRQTLHVYYDVENR